MWTHGNGGALSKKPEKETRNVNVDWIVGYAGPPPSTRAEREARMNAGQHRDPEYTAWDKKAVRSVKDNLDAFEMIITLGPDLDGRFWQFKADLEAWEGGHGPHEGIGSGILEFVMDHQPLTAVEVHPRKKTVYE
jgi:hypothetical protein